MLEREHWSYHHKITIVIELTYLLLVVCCLQAAVAIASIHVVVVVVAVAADVVSRVPVAGLKKLLSIVDWQLFQHNASPEDKRMIGWIIPVDWLKDIKVLHSLIDCFLPAANSWLHVQCCLWVCEGLGALAMKGSLASVPVINLSTLVFTKKCHQTQPEDGNVVELPSRKWTMDPDNVACAEAMRKLVTEATLLTVFISRECWTPIRALDICTINSHETVISNVVNMSVLPNNLRREVESAWVQNKQQQQQHATTKRTTYNFWLKVGNSVNEFHYPFHHCFLVDASTECCHHFHSRIDFHPHQSPQEMMEAAFIRQQVQVNKHVPAHQRHHGRDTKKLSKSCVFRRFGSFCSRVSLPNDTGMHHDVLHRHRIYPLALWNAVIKDAHCRLIWLIWLIIVDSFERLNDWACENNDVEFRFVHPFGVASSQD